MALSGPFDDGLTNPETYYHTRPPGGVEPGLRGADPWGRSKLVRETSKLTHLKGRPANKLAPASDWLDAQCQERGLAVGPALAERASSRPKPLLQDYVCPFQRPKTKAPNRIVAGLLNSLYQNRFYMSGHQRHRINLAKSAND